MATSGMIGADIGRLRALANEFAAAAEKIDADLRAVTASVRNTPWQGPTAERFRHSWNSMHATRLRSLSAQLREASRSLRVNADDQESVSNMGASAPKLASIAVGVPAKPRGFWGKVDHVTKHLPGISTVRSLYEALKGFGWDAPGAMLRGDQDLASDIIIRSTGKAFDGAVDVLLIPVKGAVLIGTTALDVAEAGTAGSDVLGGDEDRAGVFDLTSPSYWLDRAFGLR